MKNTKKLFKPILALVIILSTSMQISPMKQTQNDQVNPHLSQANKELLEKRIKNMEDTLNPNNPHFCQFSQKYIDKMKKNLEYNKKIYYGNKPYTRDDILKKDSKGSTTNCIIF
jgi:hypothetical protein